MIHVCTYCTVNQWNCYFIDMKTEIDVDLFMLLHVYLIIQL